LTDDPDEKIVRGPTRVPSSIWETVSFATESWARTSRLSAILFIINLPTVLVVVLAGKLSNSLVYALVAAVIALGIGGALIIRIIGSQSSANKILGVRSEQEATERFLNAFAELETRATAVVASQLGESPEAIPLGITLRGLAERGIWSQEELNRFRELLKMRNSLVHEEEAVNTATLDSGIAEAELLRRELKST